jgi:hypothetical protein
VNEEANSSENDELNSPKEIECSDEEYNSNGSFSVFVPDSWWYTETSLNPPSKKNIRIVKLGRTRKLTPKPLLYSGWDIKKGDYKVSEDIKDKNQEYKKPDREKIYILGLLFTILVVVLIVLYVSIGLGNSIIVDANIK